MLHLEANSYLQQEKYLYHSSEYHAGEGFRPHDHEFCEFFVVLEGELEQTLNGRSAVLPAGTVQLLLPGDAHSFRRSFSTFPRSWKSRPTTCWPAA